MVALYAKSNNGIVRNFLCIFHEIIVNFDGVAFIKMRLIVWKIRNSLFALIEGYKPKY